ncbi:MAG TPA: malto-oligosyltrehalose synthase [Tepidisphaeraceae bacterium]|jgi:(1->4)-alpha-D-glucan 1-alpha-D-glucosylmutase|nr:malto-oligosyltrehalose synthase [Tepidisphaeraceae bacterium]
MTIAKPISTYRLQFHAGFTFADARKTIPYLSALGVSHVYTSPIFKARPGSMHGYDVIDFSMLNPELGARADFDAYTDALAAHGMQQIVDIVPNHMGVATNENAWWNDCLENGPASTHGEYFDIAWRDEARPYLHDKVLLPVLGETYGEALAQGKLKVILEAGAFFVTYYERRFPIWPGSYSCILYHRIEMLRQRLANDAAALGEYDNIAASAQQPGFKPALAALAAGNEIIAAFIEENLAIFNGAAAGPSSADLLHDLLNRQFYRLAFWRTAADEINYRRFFDINDLAALRMERPEVFAQAHAFLFGLIADGKIAGLRVDHPDGLLDPAAYFARLQERFAASREQPLAGKDLLYVVAEKILAADEALAADWPIHGTTGYDFINKINALFVDSASETSMTRHYNEWIGSEVPFEKLTVEKKLQVLQSAFAGALDTLAGELERIAKAERNWRDFTLNEIRAGLGELIAVFPVYRSYITTGSVSDHDIEIVEAAVAAVIENNPAREASVFEFIGDVLLADDPAPKDKARLDEYRKFAGKFQQLTAPVTAKGIEDTAFYIYNRLVSLNEVGGDPGRFGIAPGALHAWLGNRQENWPLGLSPLSTHDTKRSEDIRARLNVLSEIPDEWWQRVARWSRLNEPHQRSLNGAPAPDRNDEYLLYQTLLGAWPLEGASDDVPGEFVTRIQNYMRKALREAKVHSTWTDPNADYETAVTEFIAAILRADRSAIFLQDFRAFQRRISHFGLLNSLSLTLLRLTAPGVPDTYQGTELWDFSLVDPDNRRPVDFQKREALLGELRGKIGSSENRIKFARQLIANKDDGRVKLFVTWQGLTRRREQPALFADGDYVPLRVTGARRDHIFSFLRRDERSVALVIVPRFLSRLGPAGELPLGESAWGDTRILLPAELRNRTFENVFTGENIVPGPSRDACDLALSEALKYFPVALFVC